MLKNDHEESKSSQWDTAAASSIKEFPAMRVKRGKNILLRFLHLFNSVYPDAAFH